MTTFLKSILITLALTVTTIGAYAAPATVKANLDSAQIVMGQITAMHVTIVKNETDHVTLLQIPDTLMTGVEVNSRTKPDTVDLGNGRQEIRQDIIIQSFDSGLYMLPPILLLQGNDTVKSNQVVLKVLPANVDTLKTVHDYAPVIEVDRKLIDYVPEFILDYGIWILLALALIAAGVYVWMKLMKEGKTAKPKKVEPPYNVAMRELQQLNQENLPARGEDKEFYTRLTEILRVYLQNRFNINAMEMTSQQILDSLNANEETRLPKQYMQQVLEVADFVKFAKLRPLPDDNVKSFQSALSFVEDTKPVPQAQQTAEGNGDSKSSDTKTSSK